MPARSLWQSWPVLPGLAGYSVIDLDPYWDPGLTSSRPHAMSDARLAGHGVCAERGASVQSWFGQYFTATSGDDWTIRLRQEPKSGLVVVTGEPTRLARSASKRNRSLLSVSSGMASCPCLRESSVYPRSF
jgi:hypothetical protein